MADPLLCWLDRLAPADHGRAGGKAASLARMRQARLPVPDGFVLFPEAFDGDSPGEAAGAAFDAACEKLLARAGAVAVRSSAAAEDSALSSFAGEFETVLGVRDLPAARQALATVRASARGARARAYESARGLDSEGGMAIVAQAMLEPSLSGVLFTADPVRSDLSVMVGSFVEGLGEQLVSGEQSGEAFRLDSMRGHYEGPEQLRPHARGLYRLARRLQRLMGETLDIEWAVAGGKLWLLQSRPISTMNGHDRRTWEINATHRGRYLWTSTNTGEAVPDVITPLTWSLAVEGALYLLALDLPGRPQFLDNIGGRLYANMSLQVSLLRLRGLGPEEALDHSAETLGRVPEGVTVPRLVMPPGAMLTRILPFGLGILLRGMRDTFRLDARLEEARAASEAAIDEIREADAATLREMYLARMRTEGPRWFSTLLSVSGPFVEAVPPMRRELTELVGAEDANTLLSGFGGSAGQLASLQLVMGVWQVARGELSREEFMREHGHRGDHELELSRPRPREDPGWLDAEIERQRASGIDPRQLVADRKRAVEEVLARLEAEDPRRGRRIRRRIEEIARLSHRREKVRNEQTRMNFVLRCFAMRAGELLGLGDDVFFLEVGELLDALAGAPRGLEHIEARKRTHARYERWSPYPAFISGRFDPEAWASDPDRRLDYHDPDAEPAPASDDVRGFPGAAGRVQGTVRVMRTPEEAGDFADGEVLVTHTTNVGWTPLFCRAAAVVTDVGAPLSHAAIVARELGIPAVVGTTNATRVLKTGMRVRVDGTRGSVEIID